MNSRRYDGYRAVHDAIARQALGGHPAAILGDLAEGLLLARSDAEADEAVALVSDRLWALVDRGEVSRFAAHRFWNLLRSCGPRVGWPVSWDLRAAPDPSRARSLP